MVDANDPIPPDAIFLTDAFEFVFRAMNPAWQNLEARCEEPIAALPTDTVISEEEKRLDEAFIQYDRAQLKANEWIRNQISGGAITAFISTPTLGKPWQLVREGWEDVGVMRSGITSNFVGPDDILNPGPDAEIDGRRRPVFFIRSDLEKLAKAAFGLTEVSPPPKDGFRKRVGAPQKHDWEEGRLYAEKIFEERGDFYDIQNRQDDWRTEMDLVRAVITHMSALNNGKEPGLSSTKKLVSGVIARKRLEK